MNRLIFGVILFTLFVHRVKSQSDVIYSQNAFVQVNGEFSDKSWIGKSDQMLFTLNYETAEFQFSLILKNLGYSMSINDNPFDVNIQSIDFKGELDLDYINTENHPPLDFDLTGWATVNQKNTQFSGSGELYHIGDTGNLVCVLGLAISLKLKDLDIELQKEMGDEIEIIIKQTLQ